jgi:hypothetical protein
MLAEPVFKAAVIAVVKPSVNLANRASHYRVLVDLHVEVTPPVLINALVFTSANAEESEFAICIAVSQAAAEEPIDVVDPETRVGCGRKDALQLIAEGIVDVLIGV